MRPRFEEAGRANAAFTLAVDSAAASPGEHGRPADLFVARNSVGVPPAALAAARTTRRHRRTLDPTLRPTHSTNVRPSGSGKRMSGRLAPPSSPPSGSSIRRRAVAAAPHRRCWSSFSLPLRSLREGRHRRLGAGQGLTITRRVPTSWLYGKLAPTQAGILVTARCPRSFQTAGALGCGAA